MKTVRRKRWTIKKIIFLSFLGLLLTAGGFAIYVGYTASNVLHTDPDDSIFKNVRELSANNGEDLTPPKWEGKERVNILLLGGDSRGLKKNEVPRSDSIMIASLDPVSKKSYLFSILRDTYVDIPDHGMDRINTAITKGGPELAMKTVSELMDIPIQYYVYTDFKGFIALVDAVGGIDLEVEKDMKYSDSADGHEYDINLKAGYQHLDGTTALQYVRFRHDATSDFTRTERQRKFMKALAEKLQSTTSIIKLPQILQSIDPYIETNLNVTQMVKLASLGFEVKTDGMISQQIPPMELLEEKRVGGAAVLGVNAPALQTFVKQLFGEVPTSTKTPTTGGKLSQGSGSGSSSSSGGTKSSASTVKPSASTKPAASVKPAATPAPSAKATVKPSASPQGNSSDTPKGSAKPGATASASPNGTDAITPTPKSADSDEDGAEDADMIDLGEGTVRSASPSANSGSTKTPATEPSEGAGSGEAAPSSASPITAASPAAEAPALQ